MVSIHRVPVVAYLIIRGNIFYISVQAWWRVMVLSESEALDCLE